MPDEIVIAKSALRTACPRTDRGWQSNIPLMLIVKVIDKLHNIR
jgi:hypothetical protein